MNDAHKHTRKSGARVTNSARLFTLGYSHFRIHMTVQVRIPKACLIDHDAYNSVLPNINWDVTNASIKVFEYFGLLRE